MQLFGLVLPLQIKQDSIEFISYTCVYLRFHLSVVAMNSLLIEDFWFTDVTPIVAKTKPALTAGLRIQVWTTTTQAQEDLSMVASVTAATRYLFSDVHRGERLNQAWQNWGTASLELSQITLW